MVFKPVSAFALCALLLACAGSALADEYRAGEFLTLDLSKAALSPKRFGPPTEFAPVAVEARSDAAQMHEEPSVDYTPGVRTTKAKQVRIEKPDVPARAKIARRHANPLDAQALDTRIQVWPCKSGGICGWKR